MSWISFPVKRPFELRNEGMFNVTSFSASSFLIVKPLSAMTLSPGSIRSRNPDNFVISTSEIQSVYSEEIEVTAPSGAIPSKHLKVFVLLCDEYNCECKTKNDGCCVLISVQSMITRVFGHVALKHSGIRSTILCLLSQIEMLPKAKYKNIAQVTNFLLTIGIEILSRMLKSTQEKEQFVNK